MMYLRQWLAALSLALATQGAFAALANPFSQLYFFGDSLSDNGNAFLYSGGVVPDPADYVDGRFSNGPVAAEIMADALGLSLTDFAVGGAKTGEDINGFDSYIHPLDGTGMQAQVAMFSALLGGSAADPNALYGVWGGPNDYFEVGLTPPETVANLVTLISDLYALGARNFFVPNMPDLGLTPRFVGTANQGAMTDLAALVNTLLDGGLATLQLSLPDARIIPFDTFNFLRGVVDDPVPLDLANVTDACLFTPSCVGDPDAQSNYLFWDGVHPTAAAHQILGTAFAEAAVPEPATLPLLAMAMVALGVLGRQKQR